MRETRSATVFSPSSSEEGAGGWWSRLAPRAPRHHPQPPPLKRRGLLAAILPLLAGACAMGPDYQRPETPPVAVGAFQTTVAGTSTADPSDRWWRLYEDPALDALIDLEIPQQPEFEMGGGGLYGTVPDYARFVRMILNQGAADDGGRVLKPKTVAAMSANQMGECRVCAVKTAMPALSNDAEFFPGMAKTWGLSFMINTERAPTGRSPRSAPAFTPSGNFSSARLRPACSASR